VRFGSRVDLWVPRDAEILVKLGDNVKGGSSVLAHWPAPIDSNSSKQQSSGVAADHFATTGNLK
jgi:hypothetical protein